MISICLTNFNREHMLYESIAQVIDDPRISEVIISDDCSDYDLYKRVVAYYAPYDKVKVSRTDTNIGCYRNKRHALSLVTSEYNRAIILDSDNIITKEYIDALFKPGIKSFGGWESSVIFQPVFAKPHFDFRKYAGMRITRKNVHAYIDEPSFATALNAMNYFVNALDYIIAWDQNMKEPWTADSIYQNMRWLEAGNTIYFCPGMEYEHRVDHTEHMSHYKEHNRKTGGLYNEVIQKLKAMR